MHRYLRAIGFSKYKNRKQLEPLYKEILSSPTSKVATTISSDTTLIQLSKSYGNGFGLSLIGELDSSGSISIEHLFPYALSNNIKILEEINIEKHCDNYSFSGIIDDINMSIIFYVINIADYEKLTWFNTKKTISSVALSAFSTEGIILIPINKTYSDLQFERKQLKEKRNLFREAKKGDNDAIESLVLKDYDLKNDIGRRTFEEDIFSIVDTSLVPYGVDCEHYEILGTILDFNTSKNTLTNETIYSLILKCNELIIRVCINEVDLTGEVSIGRRFRGIIWLQGNLLL